MMAGQPSDAPGFYSSSINEGDSSHLSLSFNLSQKSRKIHCKDY